MKLEMTYFFISVYFSILLSLILTSIWQWKTEITIQVKGNWVVMVSLLVIVIAVNHFVKLF